MIKSDLSERSYSTNARRGISCAETQPSLLSPAQAEILARLIQSHLDAYAEATEGLSLRQADPVTGRELDLIEPLVPIFHALAKPPSPPFHRHHSQKNSQL